MLSNEILDYIEENIKENLTLVELSQRYHYSPRQLYYYLHKITGMPIMTYVRQRKLVNAAQEIKFSHMAPQSQNRVYMRFCEDCKLQNELKTHFVCISVTV